MAGCECKVCGTSASDLAVDDDAGTLRVGPSPVLSATYKACGSPLPKRGRCAGGGNPSVLRLVPDDDAGSLLTGCSGLGGPLLALLLALAVESASLMLFRRSDVFLMMSSGRARSPDDSSGRPAGPAAAASRSCARLREASTTKGAGLFASSAGRFMMAAAASLMTGEASTAPG